MNGFEKLKEQMVDQEDSALKEVVNYLLSREDMEQKYLNEEKSVEEMCKFIKKKGMAHAKNGWNFISNEVVFAWAVMYFSLPNKLLGINTPKKENKKDNKNNDKSTKDNVISIDKAKQDIEKKKQVKQLSLFGGEE